MIVTIAGTTIYRLNPHIQRLTNFRFVRLPLLRLFALRRTCYTLIGNYISIINQRICIETISSTASFRRATSSSFQSLASGSMGVTSV